MSNNVQATRAELEQVLDHLNAIRKTVTGILERVEPQPGTAWERHDDPEHS